jgi:hypothetical protein
MGWKYGIMIDENRQHWKCMYCGLIRYGGGVSRLKRHLAGDLDVKMCSKVPADVVEEIREHLRKKRERRRKRAAQNGGDNVKTKSFSDDANPENLPADSVLPAGMGTNVLEEVTNQTSMVHQDPTYPRVYKWTISIFPSLVCFLFTVTTALIICFWVGGCALGVWWGCCDYVASDLSIWKERSGQI